MKEAMNITVSYTFTRGRYLAEKYPAMG